MRHNTYHGEGAAHTPVMYREVAQLLSQAAGAGDNIFIDCTLGEGGHSEIILQMFPDMRVIAFDRDPLILRIARQRLEVFGSRIEFFNDNFKNISKYIERYKGRISGILYDFGISSHHFEKSGRGFSINKDEPLDMRLDDGCRFSAFDIVNRFSEIELADIFRSFGEERHAKRIARRICESRKRGEIKTTVELAEVIFRAIPAGKRVRNIHPATRVFQSLRIAVNDELSAIRDSLSESYQFAARGGIIMAISFHSLEDRIAKDIFKRLSLGCVCGEQRVNCRCGNEPFVKILTKKPMVPLEDEIENNRRARSAKLRACMRL